MDRDITLELEQWKTRVERKPLILNGARQVGKTYALQQFASTHYDKSVYLNFEKDTRLATYFEDNLDPHDIIKNLSLYKQITIEPENTLLIFDEVQECPRALTSLKYFCEEARAYHVAAAGSLLGIKTANDSGYPVGKINTLNLYPLSFFEFLTAQGANQLRQYLADYKEFEPLPTPLHDQLLEYLRYYFFVGGMPEAVAEYVTSKDVAKTREIQLEILDAYERDFAKHAPANQFMKIVTVWQQLHKQLAKENKKFIFSVIKKSARGRDYEEAIQWLVDAGLIYKAYHVKTPKLPLSAYADNNVFKLYMLDVGLLCAQAKLVSKIIVEGCQLFTEFKGALTENYVAQSFVSRNHDNLYYWTSEGTAEVDFIIQHDNEILPLEVKAGVSSKKKSLLSYTKRYNPTKVSRSTLMNLKHDSSIFNYPLYMISRFPFKDATG